MKDRIAEYPGRVKLTPVAGQENVYDMVREDSPVQEGTRLNKATLLTDEVAAAIGVNDEDPTPNSAFKRLHQRISGVGKNMATAAVHVEDESGNPLEGVTVSGMVDESGATVQTDSSGSAWGYISVPTATLEYIPIYADIASKTTVFNTVVGGSYLDEVTLGNAASRTFTESGQIMFSDAIAGKNVNVKCVGGGGGGAGYSKSSGVYYGGGGGGGGYIASSDVSVSPGELYDIVIGAGGDGGSPNSSGYSTGGNGGITTALGVTADGGDGASSKDGGAGTGEGGSGAVYYSSSVTYNSTAGGNGVDGLGGGGGGGGMGSVYDKVTGGAGGGGDGSSNGNGNPGVDGTGGGGGGGSYNAGTYGGRGGSGVVIITIT